MKTRIYMHTLYLCEVSWCLWVFLYLHCMSISLADTHTHSTHVAVPWPNVLLLLGWGCHGNPSLTVFSSHKKIHSGGIESTDIGRRKWGLPPFSQAVEDGWIGQDYVSVWQHVSLLITDHRSWLEDVSNTARSWSTANLYEFFKWYAIFSGTW